MTAARRRPVRRGESAPRLAPPVPAKSLITGYEAAAREVGIKLMPWQKVAARYITATQGDRWWFREIAIVVARQNGKTELLLPLVRQRLAAGRRLLHTAQNRAVPRETFLRLAELLAGDPLIKSIRWANGQEVIEAHAPDCKGDLACQGCRGGRYTLVAPRPGVRGFSVDDVLLDEVREYRSFDLIAAVKPTTTASRDPQTIYLSNAGDTESVVLNDLRRRKDTDPRLAYLEWSAAPDRALDDQAGWAEANPALGVTIQPDTLADFQASLPGHIFETEHLCRWVRTTRPRIVPDHAWQRLSSQLEKPLRPAMGINMAPGGKRASAVIAWQQTDGTIACRVLADVHGDPLDTERLGKELKDQAMRLGVVQVAFDPWTDVELSRHFGNAKPLSGRDYANASENFARVIDAGRLRWDVGDPITEDLAWTARKPYEHAGAWMAEQATPDRPVTAAVAAVRAVWLASGPRQEAPRIF